MTTYISDLTPIAGFPADEDTKLIFILPFISNSRSVSLTTYNISLLYSRSDTKYFKNDRIEKNAGHEIENDFTKKILNKKFQFYSSIIFIKSLKNELCEIIFVIKRINTDEN